MAGGAALAWTFPVNGFGMVGWFVRSAAIARASQRASVPSWNGRALADGADRPDAKQPDRVRFHAGGPESLPGGKNVRRGAAVPARHGFGLAPAAGVGRDDPLSPVTPATRGGYR